MRTTILSLLVALGCASCGAPRELWWCDCSITSCHVAPAAEAVVCASTSSAAVRKGVVGCETEAAAAGCAAAACECTCAAAGSEC